MIHTKLRPLAQLFWHTKNIFFPAINPWVDVDNNKIRAYRCYDRQVEEIFALNVSATTALSETIIQPDGLVSVNGHVFDLRQDGVYRFYQLPVISEQRLVCRNGLPSLLKMIGYLWKYGKRDDLLSEEKLLNAVKNKTLLCGCHNLSVTAKHLFNAIGTSVRLVATMSQEEWGGQDDGHTLLEIEQDGRFVAYDPSFNCMFYRDGSALSLHDLAQSDISTVTLKKLPGHPGHAEFTTGSYDYGFWVEERFLSEASLHQWYSRVFDVPLIMKEGRFYYPESYVRPAQIAKFKRYYRPLNDSDFRTSFYNTKATL